MAAWLSEARPDSSAGGFVRKGVRSALAFSPCLGEGATARSRPKGSGLHPC